MRRNLVLLWAAVLLTAMLSSPVSAASAQMRLRSSDATVYRGQNFTLTVSLSNDQPVSNGGVILSYDSSVFELTGGSCNVKGATLAEVSASRGGGVFVMQQDAVVSGTIFTIKMRVKDNAAFGSYKISGSASLSVSCSFSGTSVTVACKHSYGNYAKVDDSQHKGKCTLCGDSKTEAHAWNSGTVTKAATCKETGIKKRTCTVCNATKDEVIPVTGNHKYSSWSKVDDRQHTRSCSVCGKQEKTAHNWNKGTVLEKATCQQTGVRKRTCTGCGITKEETVAKTGHAYGPSVSVDETNHTHSCTVCSKEATEAHSYSGWKHDQSRHFQSCKACGHEKDADAHVPGPKATETTDQICTVCNRVLQPKGAHKHSFAEQWSTDETGHWYACSGCNEREGFAAHSFADNCDATCDLCAMTRQPPHAPEETVSWDASGHWYACTQCGEKLEFSAHTPGEDEAKTCTTCGFEENHTHSFLKNHSHQCACGEICQAEAGECPVCNGFPWWLLCVAEAVVFAAILLGVLLWKRKGKNNADMNRWV